MADVAISLRIDETLKAQVAAWAEAEMNSTNGMIERILKRAVTDAKAGMVEEAEAAKSKLETLTAVFAVALAKGPGEELTTEDFEDGTPAAAWFAAEKAGLEHDADEDWSPEDFMIGFSEVKSELDTAVFYHERHQKVMKALEAVKVSTGDDLVDGHRRINRAGRQKISDALEIRGASRNDLSSIIGYSNATNGSNALDGHTPLSPRAVRLLRIWLEETEFFKPDSEAKPNLSVVE